MEAECSCTPRVDGPPLDALQPLVAGASDSTLPQPTPARPRTTGLAPGATWGRYEIVRELGRGGMGAVYLARDTRLERMVALKVLRQAELADDADRARFEREAAATASLAHPNIVALFEVGDVDGSPFLAMEYVDGTPLDALLRESPPAVPRALELVRDVALALDFAHGRGLVHRDIKPGNILLARDGTPKLADFGMARRERSTALTVSGAVIGTPAYMAPEQALGQTEQTDARSDVYGLGAVLYELLTMTPPHVGGTVLDVLQSAAEHDPRPPRQLVPRLPRDVETLCLKALARSPARRYQTAAAFADDITRYLERRPILARRPSLAYRVGRWIQRRPMTALLLILALAAVAATAHALTRPGALELTVRDRGGPLARGLARVGARTLRIRDGVARGELPAGTHALVVGSPGHEPYRGVVEIRRGATRQQTVTLARHQGVFELETGPPGAAIFVDGVDYGSRLRGLKVDAGPHEILVRREGHHDARMTWVAERGKTRRGLVYLSPAMRWQYDILGSNIDLRWVGDVDRDGLPDFLTRHSIMLSIHNPWTGKQLYHRALGRLFDQFVSYGDVDGDGRVDAVGILLRDGGRTMQLVSWRMPGNEQIASYAIPTGTPRVLSVARPKLLDLDGDGRLEVLLYSLFAETMVAYEGTGKVRWRRDLPHHVIDVVEARDDRRERLLVAISTRSISALDPRTGAVRWTRPVPKAFEGARLGERVRQRAHHSVPWARTLELDGTPGDELLVPVLGPDNADVVQLRAFDLRDGRPLWASTRGRFVFASSPIGDVDGDGIADICYSRGRGADRGLTTSMLDGRDGRTRWERPIGGRIALVAPPGQPAQLAWLPRGKQALVLLDGRDGTRRVRVPLAEPAVGVPVQADWDGDGRPEILVGTADGTVAAYGFDGAIVGSCLIRQQPDRIVPFGDVNGDGAPDLMIHGSGPALLMGPVVRWARRFRGQQWIPPVSGDFDGDGKTEVAVYGARSMFRGRFRFVDPATGVVRAVNSRQMFARRPPLVLPREGGGHDLLVTEQQRLVRVRGTDGETTTVATIPRSFASPRLGDVDGDGKPEVLISTWNAGRSFLVLDGETLREKRRGPLPQGSWFAPRVAELDGHPGAEMIVHCQSGQLVVIDARTSAIRWQRQLVPNATLQEPLLLDADRDGLPDLVCTSPVGSACYRGSDGERLWVQAGLRSPAIGAVAADTDGDGHPEAIFGMTDGIAAVDARTGRTVWQVPTTAVGALSTADLDGDGRPEVLSVHTDGTMRAYDVRGGRLRWWFVRGKEVQSSPLAIDTDGDGRLEVLVTGDGGHMYCLAPRLKRRP